jgi:hypothetical protein
MAITKKRTKSTNTRGKKRVLAAKNDEALEAARLQSKASNVRRRRSSADTNDENLDSAPKPTRRSVRLGGTAAGIANMPTTKRKTTVQGKDIFAYSVKGGGAQPENKGRRPAMSAKIRGSNANAITAKPSRQVRPHPSADDGAQSADNRDRIQDLKRQLQEEKGVSLCYILMSIYGLRYPNKNCRQKPALVACCRNERLGDI